MEKMHFCLGSSSNSQKLKNPIVDGIISDSNSMKRLYALIVDDNKVNRTILKAMLKNLGVEAYEVENGQEAVDLYQGGAIFDLILMDFEMPILDGPQATRILRGMGVECKIIGVSGNTRNIDKQAFMEAGIDEYIVKPLTHSKLISILKKL